MVVNKANIVHLYYRKIILHWLLFFMREIPLAKIFATAAEEVEHYRTALE
jgi:hypothetical protein